jgi:hypothetical protein
MMLPTVHLNGTSKEALLDGYCDALTALHGAVSKVQAAGPNGRDYYPQGDKAIQTAMAEHEARLTKLREIITEIETIAESL